MAGDFAGGFVVTHSSAGYFLGGLLDALVTAKRILKLDQDWDQPGLGGS